MTSPRRALSAAIALAVAAGAMLSAAPAMAMTPRVVIPGWSPADPPELRAYFDAQMASVVYAVTCHGVTSSGWSSVMPDDTTYDWRSMIVTTSEVGDACAYTRDDVTVRQGDRTVPAYAWIFGSSTGLGSAVAVPHLPGAYWDFTPSPRIGQWVGIGGRAADGTMLPILERRITAVGESSFTLDQPVGAEYLGAPVADNKMRILGSLTRPGTEITGSPVYCEVLFVCADPPNAWWDITAPSEARDVKLTPGKGRVTVTWKPAASDGGDTVDYSYRVGKGPWVKTDKFKAIIKARKGALVTVSVSTINHAGAGPTVVLSARAK